MIKFLAYLFPVLLLTACNQDNQAGQVFKNTLPDSNGGRLEIIVVAEEHVWQDVAGEILRKYFTEAQYGLPQPEPIFTVNQIAPKQFNTLLQRTRNLIILQIGESGYSHEVNKYAKPQHYFTFSAPTEKDLALLVKERQNEVVSIIRQSEIDYLQKRLVVKHMETPDLVSSHHGTIKIPLDYELEQSTENTAVFWKKGLKSDQGIIIHFEPLSDDDMVIGDRIVPLRDSLTRIYVQGEKAGSYMVVEDLIAPEFINREFGDNFTIEARGLWRTYGDFMGGAFVNYSVFDEVNKQRIMLDGFVYAPEMNKRNLLLELEAILQTFETVN